MIPAGVNAAGVNALVADSRGGKGWWGNICFSLENISSCSFCLARVTVLTCALDHPLMGYSCTCLPLSKIVL